MGKSQRTAVGGSQDPAVSPARRFTRASARNNPLEATHPASRNPSPIRNPTKKVTKRKGSRVSPLLQRLRSITSEWEKERDARGQSMKPTSSTRRAVLQDSEGPLEEHDDRDVPSLFDPTALTQDDDDTIPPTQADDETLPPTQDMETAESDMPLLDEGPGSDPTLMTGTEAGNMAPLDEMTSHDGDTLSLVKVFVTSASVPDTPLILPTISGATTLRDVVGEDPIEWSYKDLMRRA
ncbi:uncharacterized protein LOC127251200 isoform X1 [Andrographis paniculata]|uniref:uncharacterized protein LOC127251200 isoform X1 n=1 Tax=Andrographis paniculata TaxID=175694 RepID=UPI0021E7BBD6|nr:uncharacterized protein LOC127251200 isoform X1 [Andrographis paniculata]